MLTKDFHGIMPALITPFDDNENIKDETVKQIIDFQLDQGVNGFYICGSSGEGPVLRPATRMSMAEIVMNHVKKRGVVIDHIGAINMHDTLDLVKHATQTGVDAIASLAPSYLFKYTFDELVAYYQTIAEATNLPVIAYATGMMDSSSIIKLMTRLMTIPNIIGIKFTIRDYFLMRQVKEINDGEIILFNGPDETLLCGLAMGADGGIGSTYNIMPGWFVQLYNSFMQNDLQSAQENQYRINQVIRILLQYGENGVNKSVKATLQMMGFDTGNTAFPARALSLDEKQNLRRDLVAAGIKI